MICDEREVPLDEFETVILCGLLEAQAELAAALTDNVDTSNVVPIGARRQPRMARVLAVAASVALVAVGAVAVIGRGATTASAAPALPKPLAFSHGSSAEGVTLLEYAAVAQQNAPSRSGPVYYAKTQNYALQVTVGNHRSTSVVATTVRQVWRSPDGSTLVREYLQDTAPAGGDIGGPKSPGNLDHSGRYRPGQWADLNVGFPVDRAAAQVALHNPNTDRTPSLVNITLAYEIIQHLESGTANPRQTGALYQVLASLPEVFYAGTVVDNAGRSGQAVGIVVSDISSPTTATSYVVLDPASGTLLQTETVFTPNAPPALHLPPGPTVEDYNTILAAGPVHNVGTTS